MSRTPNGPAVEWRITTVEATGSTNVDLAAAARAGEAVEGSVLVAGRQTAGRGRLGRQWESPPGTSLSCSLLLQPPMAVPAARWTWLPLLTGVAVVDAVSALAPTVPARLKWPNDVLVSGAKLAGILVERVDTPSGPAAVVGVGVNVGQADADLPDGATSLAALGVAVTVDQVRLALLESMAARYGAWARDGGDPATGLRPAYTRLCDTLGRQVRVELPGRPVAAGQALDVDANGRLVVQTADGPVAVSAGDVVHVRQA